MAPARTVIALLIAMASVATTLAGGLTVRTVRPIHGTDADDPGSVSEGVAAVEGRAREGGGTVTAPLTGTECLSYTVEVEKRSLSWMTLWE